MSILGALVTRLRWPKYTFNAQFHYVWDCGEGHTVNQVLKNGLDQDVTFER